MHLLELKKRARAERDSMILRWYNRGIGWFEIQKLLDGGSEFVRHRRDELRGKENRGNMIDEGSR